MKLLITGANSYVGARLYLDLKRTYEAIGTYGTNQLSKQFLHLDVTDRQSVLDVIRRIKPNVVIHVAASANARWCEANPKEALKLNQFSTGYVVDAANKINAKVIFMSSFAALNTSNIYGKTKKESEELVKKTNAGYIILRPSLILGYSPNTVNDRPFNRLLKNLNEKTSAEYDTSWKFQPTYVRHLSEIISSVLDKNIVNEIIPVAVPDLKSRFDTARDILTPFGIKVTPIDKHDTLSVTQEDLSTLNKLRLRQYSYQEMIQDIVEEIKHKDRFVLP